MIATIFRIVAQFMAALFCFIPALIGSYTTGSDYTIPQIDLSAPPASKPLSMTAGIIWLTRIPCC